MKYVVATYTRVGSTWVADVLACLTGLSVKPLAIEHELGVTVPQATVKRIVELPDAVYKTHNFTMHDAIPLMEAGIGIVNVQRNFYDTIVSLLLYCKDVRTKQGLDNVPPVQSLIDEFGNELEDDEFINLFIESRDTYLRECIRDWHLFAHVVSAINAQTINYDDVSGDTMRVVKALQSILPEAPTNEAIKLVKEQCSLGSMKKNYAKGHVRRGQSGAWQQILDDISATRIKNLVSQIRQKKTYNEL